MKKFDVVIIGGGIIGTAIFYELCKYDLNTALLEANPVLAKETSTGNSGVIHGGFDPEPHKIEAKLNVLGNQMWVEKIFPNLEFPRQKVDSLIIAFNEEEMKHVYMLYDRGIINKVLPSDLKILSKQELLTKEPNLNPDVFGALLCTSSYAIDPVKASYAFASCAINNGCQLFTNAKVVKIKKVHEHFEITTLDNQVFVAKRIINAAGHYADEMAKLANYNDFELTTKRGEYIVLDSLQKNIVNSICFKVPTIHGKGVIVAPMLDGNILVGPTAEDHVPKKDVALVTQEKYNLIVKIGKELVPSLDFSRVTRRYAGSRPIYLKTNDFIIEPAKNDVNFINVAGTQSPGLSCAPAIAVEVVKLLEKSGLKLQEKTHYNLKYKIL